MGKVIRYGLAGIVTTAVNYLLFVGGVKLGFHYLFAATASSGMTLIVSYFVNRSFTFAAPGTASVIEFGSFIGVFAVQYLVAMFGYALLIGQLGLNPSAAFVLNSGVVAMITFVLLRSYTFRRPD
jgi:putative flippase GtrA